MALNQSELDTFAQGSASDPENLLYLDHQKQICNNSSKAYVKKYGQAKILRVIQACCLIRLRAILYQSNEDK